VEEAAVDEERSDRRSILLKILISVAVLAAVATVWLMKNGVLKKQDESTASPTQSVSAADAAEQNDNDFALEVESVDLFALLPYRLPIVIDFGSDSCIPCQEMAPVLKSANEDYRGKAIVKFVDVRKYPDAVASFPIQVIPTQIFINADGTPYKPGEGIDVEFIFYSAKDTQKHVFTAHQGGLTEEQMRAILTDMGAGE